MPHSQALDTFREWVQRAREAGVREGTVNYPMDFGDQLLARSLRDAATRRVIDRKRVDGVRDEDIRWWWNLPDLDRRLMLAFDDHCRIAVFLDQLSKSEEVDKDKAAEKAAAHVRKYFPMYSQDLLSSDPENTITSGDDRPLPVELKDRVNRYTEKQAQIDPVGYKERIERATTCNALVREDIRKGNL